MCVVVVGRQPVTESARDSAWLLDGSGQMVETIEEVPFPHPLQGKLVQMSLAVLVHPEGDDVPMNPKAVHVVGLAVVAVDVAKQGEAVAALDFDKVLLDDVQGSAVWFDGTHARSPLVSTTSIPLVPLE